MRKHLYIFRHGQTIWNAEGRPQGQHEYPVPLTAGYAITAFITHVFGKRVQRVENCDYIHITYDAEKDVFEAIDLFPEQYISSRKCQIINSCQK